MLQPYCIQRKTGIVQPNVNTRAFTPIDLKTLYNFPVATLGTRLKVAIVSFGGGVYGNVDSNGIVKGGDFEPYWRGLGITKFPIVRLQLIGNARNLPDGSGASTENIIDISTIGAMAENTELILVIAPNTDAGFIQVFQTARAIPGIFCISCSWGLPETAMPVSFVNTMNNIFKECAEAGINICVASGDNGFTDGTSVATVDFPGSSPYVVCCGGTSLRSATNVYDSKTEEIVWNNNPRTSATGGGKSVIFTKHACQQNISLSNMRMTPDVALVGDPNTGIIYRVGGTSMVVGGTSVVAPQVAALCCLLRCNTFLNPLLYTAPNVCFHDITSGNNGGTWRATSGYDMCSGLGSLNGTLLKNFISENVLQITPSSLNFTNSLPKQLVLRTIGSQTKPKTITWTSSNSKIAIVDNTGLVTPVSNGTCFVTCSASTTIVNVVVSNVSVLATAISVIPNLMVGKTLVFTLASTIPINATSRTILWISLHPRIASVHPSTGAVTGLTPGTVTLQAKLQDANQAQTTITLQVVAAT